MVITAAREALFPQNQWWPAAVSPALGQNLAECVLVGQPLVLYRTAAGEPIALDNRCAHRGFPLSKGTRIGDGIQCGYHGHLYDASGACVAVPSTVACEDRVPPRMRVTSFPVADRPPFIWVWMGDAALADPALIPDPGLVPEGWTYISGSSPIRGSWRHMHDNLLDATHLTYLHGGAGGTDAYATAPIDVEKSDTGVSIRRCYVDESRLAGWAIGKTTPIQRDATTTWRGPGLITSEIHMREAARLDDPDAPVARVRFLHGIAPESSTQLVYHWVVARDFLVDDEEVTEQVRIQSLKAFDEDVAALEWIADLRRASQVEAAEISVRADSGALYARRLLESLIDR